MSVLVVHPGARTSIERATRGRAHEGVSVGGPFDPRAALRANRLVGNRDDAAVLEVVFLGPTLRFLVDTRVAVVGAIRSAGVMDVHRGQELAVGNVTRGLRASVAVRGGFRGAGVLVKGAELVVGDDVGDDMGEDMGEDIGAVARVAPEWVLPDALVLRVTDAPHSDGVIERLVARTWTVSPKCDRAGVRLDSEGEAGALSASREIMSMGVSVGAVQLFPNGTPVILGVDRATTGGYPVIAHVASADRWLLGQLRPGASVRFTHVSMSAAIAAARE